MRLGVTRGLFIGGVVMASSNLLFAWLAMAGPDKSILLLAILTDNFTTAFSTVAFVSFLTALTGKAFSATQYALLASIGNAGRTVLASSGGWFVDWTGGQLDVILCDNRRDGHSWTGSFDDHTKTS